MENKLCRLLLLPGDLELEFEHRGHMRMGMRISVCRLPSGKILLIHEEDFISIRRGLFKMFGNNILPEFIKVINNE